MPPQIQPCILVVICYTLKTHTYSNIYVRKKSNTLNSVGTISLGVSNPINISRPTKHKIDMKMEKSLISFLSYSSTNTHDRERVNRDVQCDNKEGRHTSKGTRKGGRHEEMTGNRRKNHYADRATQIQITYLKCIKTTYYGEKRNSSKQ